MMGPPLWVGCSSGSLKTWTKDQGHSINQITSQWHPTLTMIRRISTNFFSVCNSSVTICFLAVSALLVGVAEVVEESVVVLVARVALVTVVVLVLMVLEVV